jgi:hypothetical protein
LLFSIYSLATLSVVISLRYGLPFSVAATRCTVAVLFGGSSKFLQLAALKHVSVSVTVRREFCWCFPDFGVFVFGLLNSDSAMQPFEFTLSLAPASLYTCIKLMCAVAR